MPHQTDNKHHRFIKKMILVPAVMLLSASSLISCSPAQSSNHAVAQFGYTKMKSIQDHRTGISEIRLKALQDTALALGAQGGLAWRSNKINHMLQEQSAHFDLIFNFNELIINHNVLPPVLTVSQDNYEQSSNNMIRLNQKTYKIVSPARFVTVPPTWRDYLLMNYPMPNQPDNSLLPQNNAEVSVWNTYLAKGWDQGLRQANEIFRENIARMKRDFTGIVLYKKLLEQHMVSAPYIATAKLGVTGDHNKISINDQVMRITKSSELNTNAAKWNAVITKQ